MARGVVGAAEPGSGREEGDAVAKVAVAEDYVGAVGRLAGFGMCAGVANIWDIASFSRLV